MIVAGVHPKRLIDADDESKGATEPAKIPLEQTGGISCGSRKAKTSVGPFKPGSHRRGRQMYQWPASGLLARRFLPPRKSRGLLALARASNPEAGLRQQSLIEGPVFDWDLKSG
jgi:hypothetical protein